LLGTLLLGTPSRADAYPSVPIYIVGVKRQISDPVIDTAGTLVGVVTRRDLLDVAHPDSWMVRDVVRRAPVVVYDDSTLRDAADQMVLAHVGRLPVVRRRSPGELVGIVSRSDLLAAHAPRLEAAHQVRRVRRLTFAARDG
jgi:CBS domain-containing protein